MKKQRLSRIQNLLQPPPMPRSDPKRLEETIVHSKKMWRASQLGSPVRTKFREFFFLQFRFIGLKVWGIHLLIVLFAALSAHYFLSLSSLEPLQVLAMISALTPLLALVGAQVFARSFQRGLVELELSTKYSSGKLLLARISILAITDTVCLTGLLCFLTQRFDQKFYLLFLYMLVPFIIAYLGCLWIINNAQNKGSACLSYVGLLVLTLFLLSFRYETLYATSVTGIWIVVLMISSAALVIEIRRTLASYRNVDACSLSYS